jgi:hypothetical protein
VQRLRLVARVDAFQLEDDDAPLPAATFDGVRLAVEPEKAPGLEALGEIAQWLYFELAIYAVRRDDAPHRDGGCGI